MQILTRFQSVSENIFPMPCPSAVIRYSLYLLSFETLNAGLTLSVAALFKGSLAFQHFSLFTYFIGCGSNISFAIGGEVGKSLEMIIQHYLFNRQCAFFQLEFNVARCLLL